LVAAQLKYKQDAKQIIYKTLVETMGTPQLIKGDSAVHWEVRQLWGSAAAPTTRRWLTSSNFNEKGHRWLWTSATEGATA
jgi:hypothetical protein